MPEVPSFLEPINRLPGIKAGWMARVRDLPITGGRDDAMRVLRPFHEQAVERFGGAVETWWRAEQVHGSLVARVPDHPTVPAADGLPVVPAADGLITATPGVVLAIYVADCGPIWLADRATGAIGLLHSGKKGTEANILECALQEMRRHFGTRPEDVTAVLGPCIRPPHYETDFAASIGRQAAEVGIGRYFDCGEDTAADLARHYSYRMERGVTGRMMALLVKDRPFMPGVADRDRPA